VIQKGRKRNGIEKAGAETERQELDVMNGEIHKI
jgi:hypothetical protein